MRRRPLWLVLCCCALLALPAVASATFPGTNGVIAFVRDGDIWAVNTDGSGLRQITTDPRSDTDPAWSPDGTTVAFSRGQEGARDWAVWTIRLDGTGRKQVTTATATERDPGWSPDGRRIVYVSETPAGESQLRTVRPDGTDDRFLYKPAGYIESVRDPDWSPDGRRIAFDESYDTGCARTVRSDGSDVRSIHCPESLSGFGDYTSGFTWAPSGGRVAFAESRSGPDGEAWPTRIAAVSPEGTGFRHLTDGLAFDGQPSWSPDGSKIVFSAVKDGEFGTANGPSDLYVMAANGSGQQRLTTLPGDEWEPVWQPLPPPNPLPVVSSISPSSAIAGRSALQLTVNGTGFIASSTVRWNGVDRPTTRVSAARLTASISTADLATVGISQVQVVTPAPGGGASAPRNFTVTSSNSTVPAPTNIAVPTIQGAAVQGTTLACQVGSWSNAPSGFAWRWLRNGAPIVGAEAPSYVPTAGDVGEAVFCRVTATNAGGSSSAVSAPVVIVGPPEGTTVPSVVSGPLPSPTVGSTATPPVPQRAIVRLRMTAKTARVRLGRPVRLGLRFSRVVTRLPVQVQRKVGKRWVKVASRTVSGRSPVVSVRLRAAGLYTLRVRFARGSGLSFTTPVKVRVVR